MSTNTRVATHQNLHYVVDQLNFTEGEVYCRPVMGFAARGNVVRLALGEAVVLPLAECTVANMAVSREQARDWSAAQIEHAAHLRGEVCRVRISRRGNSENTYLEPMVADEDRCYQMADACLQAGDDAGAERWMAFAETANQRVQEAEEAAAILSAIDAVCC